MEKKNQSGPVDVSSSPFVSRKTLNLSDVSINGGFWQHRQKINQKVSLLHGYQMLTQAGNLQNLKIAAGLTTGVHQGRNFSDETVYKWLEAVGWELGRSGDELLKKLADEVITLIEAAQQEDGYLDSYYQIAEPDQKFADLDHSHELYCAGFLMQAAVAFQRAIGDDRLLRVACRVADHLDSVFGPGKREGTCGHPEIEMALVELYRLTRNQRYLNLSLFFVDQRGKGQMRGYAGYGAEYHQDHVAVRAAQELAGHAVRQMYLLNGISDLYIETGEPALLDTALRLWNDLVHSKMYITGGVGSRYDGEAFGNSYELPPDVCYCETCAAIANLFWNWRLLLITGESQYADLIERTLYNAILSSPGLDGAHYYYANPLMVRDGRYVRLSSNPPEGQVNGRPKWHDVACCPPNVMRLLASLGHYIATYTGDGIQIHQYGQAKISVSLQDTEPVILQMDSNYPWDGKIFFRIEKSSNAAFCILLRVPAWSRNVSVKINQKEIRELCVEHGYIVLNQLWKPGDEIELNLPMPELLVKPNPRIDAIRDCLAIQRGPILFCLEAHDQKAGINLLDVQIDPHTAFRSAWWNELDGVLKVEAQGYLSTPEAWQSSLYQPVNEVQEPEKQPIGLTAIPYFVWGNRGLTGMRVWIPAT